MINIAMIPRNDEPMEGEVFLCAGPYPTDKYQWTGTHGDMISLDLHGAEEPIRWFLGW